MAANGSCICVKVRLVLAASRRSSTPALVQADNEGEGLKRRAAGSKAQGLTGLDCCKAKQRLT